MSKLTKIGKANQQKQIIQPQNDLPKLNPKQKINFYLTNIQQKIIQQIDLQTQKISSKKSPFFQDTNSITIKQKQQQLKKLNEEKNKAQNKLKQLNDKQFSLQHEYRMKLKSHYLSKNGTVTDRAELGNNNKTLELKNTNTDKTMENEFLQQDSFLPANLSSKSKSLNKLRPRSQLTIKDVQTLKNLKKDYIKFQQQVSQKTVVHNEQLQKIKRQNEELQLLLKKQKTQIRRRQIEGRLKDLEKQKSERIKKFQQQKMRLQQIKRKPRRFQKLIKDFQCKEKSFEEQKVQQMKQRLKKKLLNIAEINHHQQRYQQLRTQQLKQIEEKYLEQSRFLKQSKAQPQIISRFYRSVLQEEKQKKNQQKRKQLATIEKCQRIKSYAAKVHQQYAPRLKTRQNEEDENQQQQNNDKSLSIEQRKQLGNNYLKDAINHLKKNQKSKSSTLPDQNQSQTIQLPKISSNSTKYKDYLSQERTRYPSAFEREKASQKKAKLRYNHSIQEVKKLMNQQFNEKNKYNTIEKIKKIAQKLQHDPNDRNYLDKIKAKLQILQTIT